MIDTEDLESGRPWALASLRIASETLSPEEIGELLDLRATSSRLSEGEPEFSVWMYESGLPPTAAVEDHLYILMERLRDCQDALRELVDTATVEVWLSFSPGERHRSAVIDAKVLSTVSGLGLDIVLDAYPPGRAKPKSSAAS